MPAPAIFVLFLDFPMSQSSAQVLGPRLRYSNLVFLRVCYLIIIYG